MPCVKATISTLKGNLGHGMLSTNFALPQKEQNFQWNIVSKCVEASQLDNKCCAKTTALHNGQGGYNIFLCDFLLTKYT